MKELHTLNILVEYVVHDDATYLAIECRGRHFTPDVQMYSTDGKQWKAQFVTPKKNLQFRFKVLRQGNLLDEEMKGQWHVWDSSLMTCVTLVCRWNTHGYRSYLYSSAYKDCIFRSRGKVTPVSPLNLVLKQNCFINAEDDMKLAVVGNVSELGNWNPFQAPLMTHVGSCGFELRIKLQNCNSLEYKYILTNGKRVVWEPADNRMLSSISENEELVLEDSPVRLGEREGRIGGVVVPVFSLRSQNSQGVGDFGDLGRMVDLTEKLGLHLLQILPVGDTTRTGSWTDSYPYNAISAFAIHPMYVDLHALPSLRNRKLLNRLERQSKRLNELPLLDYEKVNQLKETWLRAYFKQDGKKILLSSEYRKFKQENSSWLTCYCCFRFLQSYFHTSNHRQWPSFQVYDEKSILQWVADNGYQSEIEYYAVVQYILDFQLGQVHLKARRKGIVLKGDIPIGISRDSATTWLTPQYFHFDGQAGAPPDYFSDDGQNWGFPTYHWENILKEGGQWWKSRLRGMAKYFDAYRIDHVLGFFRIWEIPYPYRSGMVGYFNPALPLTEHEIRQFGFSQPLPKKMDLDLSEEILKSKLFFYRDGGYCPNIGCNRTEAYHQLSMYDKRAYDNLFNDYFYVRHDVFWTQGALQKLAILLSATNMLACAEDLGMLPACMRKVLDHFQILSLEVETMPKYSWGRFANLSQNPLLSVDTISTHDMPPLRLWWKQNPDAAQEYYNSILWIQGYCPALLPASLCKEIVYRHLASPSLLCVLSLQDWLSIDEEFRSENLEREQINDPANSHHYWRYRMDVTIEQLASSSRFKTTVHNLLKKTDRNVHLR